MSVRSFQIWVIDYWNKIWILSSDIFPLPPRFFSSASLSFFSSLFCLFPLLSFPYHVYFSSLPCIFFSFSSTFLPLSLLPWLCVLFVILSSATCQHLQGYLYQYVLEMFWMRELIRLGFLIENMRTCILIWKGCQLSLALSSNLRI